MVTICCQLKRKMSDEYNYNEEIDELGNQIFKLLREIREKNKQIEELELELEELPKKIYNEILWNSQIEKNVNDAIILKISFSNLKGITKKYTKEQEDERD